MTEAGAFGVFMTKWFLIKKRGPVGLGCLNFNIYEFIGA
jgi:hypothetical protein